MQVASTQVAARRDGSRSTVLFRPMQAASKQVAARKDGFGQYMQRPSGPCLHNGSIQIPNSTSAWSSFAMSASLSVQSRAWQFSITRARCCVPKRAVVRNDF